MAKREREKKSVHVNKSFVFTFSLMARYKTLVWQLMERRGPE